MWAALIVTELLVVAIVFRHGLSAQVTRVISLKVYRIRTTREIAMRRLDLRADAMAAARPSVTVDPTPARTVAPIELPHEIEAWASEESEGWAQDDRRDTARKLYTEAGGSWDRVLAHLGLVTA